MIIEHADLRIKAGSESAFESSMDDAKELLAQAPGFHGMELRRVVEMPGRYILLVRWESVEHHTVNFQRSPLFTQWRALLGAFFDGTPAVFHSVSVVSRAP